MPHITICGGGSLGLVCAAFLASQPDVRVSLYTRHPGDWQQEISCTDPDGKEYRGRLDVISYRAAEVIPQADIVLFTLPGFLIRQTLQDIRPHLHPRTLVGSIVSSTGFFFTAHEVLEPRTPLFGFQRVPFIARVDRYGSHGLLLGYKPSLAMALENVEDREDAGKLFSRLFATPVSLLASHYEASLTNSNPILHTGRLWSMWHDWQGESRPGCGLFYREWDEASAQVIIDMDAEFQQLLQRLPVTPGAIPTLLDYYESSDAASLAAKLRSIKAFQAILSPMTETPDGWVPDFHSRYFTEDFPYGLHFIWQLCREHHIPAPVIGKVYEWGMSRIDRTQGKDPLAPVQRKTNEQ